MRAIAREIEIMYRLTKMTKNFFTVKLLDAFVPAHVTDVDSCDSLYIVMDYVEHNL
jgi:serine/threonine protein kinase